jgi:hypothetical protein
MIVGANLVDVIDLEPLGNSRRTGFCRAGLVNSNSDPKFPGFLAPAPELSRASKWSTFMCQDFCLFRADYTYPAQANFPKYFLAASQ